MTSMMAAGGVMGNAACQQRQTTTTAQVNANSSSTTTEPSTDSSPVAPPLEIPHRILGRTQVEVPIFGLGGAGRTPLSRPKEEQEAIAIIERAFELGIRHFDTAANYGPSEERLGNVLSADRAQLFLASKTGYRDRDGSWQELERSLQRLQTDFLDPWPFHRLTCEWYLNTL